MSFIIDCEEGSHFYVALIIGSILWLARFVFCNHLPRGRKLRRAGNKGT
jgi:hypothetical protein